MPLSRLPRSALLALCLMWFGALAGCSGCSGLRTTAVVCKEGDCCHNNADCVAYEKGKGVADPSNYFCDTTNETCFPITKVCTDQGQCCPGQSCSATIGQCVDSYTACTSNANCYVAGQICNPMLGSFPVGPGCTFNTCNLANGNADCAAGLSCFNSYCVGEPPCGGGCGAGEVCTPVNNQCYKPDNPSSACQQSCQAGYMLVFTYGENVFNLCDPLEDVDCECEALPDIQSSDTVRYSGAAVAGSSILVSAYDGQYGDLVLHTYDKSTLAQTNLEWVDGVPTTGTITGDPSGPRGGRAEPGLDVGRYTSIAYDSTTSTTHIAYYAAATDGAEDINPTGTAGTPIQALRYATRTGTGPWTIVTVDGWNAVGTDTAPAVGQYTSITISPDGAPVISYFQANGYGPNATISAIKVARGTVPQPQSAADFTISTIETETVPAPPATPVSPVGLSPGDGLFTGIAYLDSVPVVVWYDATKMQLKGIIAGADSASQGAAFSPADIQILDNGTTAGSTAQDDVGRYASLAIGPTSAAHRIAVAYVDETSRQTKLITADAAWANLAQTVIDSGAGAATGDTQLFVGSDTSVAFLNGLISVTYQDQTTVALRLATQGSTTAPVQYKSVLDQDGAGGFYGRLVSDGTNLYVAHAVIQANLSGTNVVSANKLHVLKVQ